MKLNFDGGKVGKERGVGVCGTGPDEEISLVGVQKGLKFSGLIIEEVNTCL